MASKMDIDGAMVVFPVVFEKNHRTLPWLLETVFPIGSATFVVSNMDSRDFEGLDDGTQVLHAFNPRNYNKCQSRVVRKQ